MDLRDAQSGQRQFDADHWEVNGNDFVKLRHITLHLATLLTKIGRHCEQNEHGEMTHSAVIRREVVPDLVIYALQIANLLGVDVEDVYKERLDSNRKRHPRANK